MGVSQSLQGSEDQIDDILGPPRAMQIACKNTLRVETRPVGRDVASSYGDPPECRLFVFIRKAGQG